MEKRKTFSLIILHGWNSEVKRWQPVVEELEKAGFSVHLPVLPGFTGGAGLERAWELVDYAQWVESFLKEKKLDKSIILGHSFGGQIAALVAIRQKVKFKALVLVGAAVIRGKKSLKKSVFYALAKAGRVACWLPPFCFLVKPLRCLIYKAAREKDYYQAQGYLRETMKKVIQEDLSDQLLKIKAPTLICWGKEDKDTPAAEAHQLKKLIPNAQLKLYSGTHGFIFKQAKEVIREILKFYQDL